MKKLLILTASTGEGHNQAANSLKEVFESKGYEVVTLDFIKSNSKVLSTTFIGGYEFFASIMPKIYGLLYNVSNIKFANKVLSLIFSSISKKLYNFIKEYDPNVIITTHPLAVNLLDSLKKKGLNTPAISVVTDFKAHSTYISKYIDMYITASEYTNNSLISNGISRNKLFSFGIPVKDDFKASVPDLLSTRDPDFFNILLMSGSMGLNQISHVLKELLTNTHKLRITVVCGNNKALKENLIKKYKHINKDKKLHILGFSNDISSLMDYSDLIITKPGGLTVTEAITKNLPLVIPFTIPGQEVENADFLTSEGYAIKIDNLLELNSIVDNIIDNPETLKQMRKNLNLLSKNYSNDKIYKTINDLVDIYDFDKTKNFYKENLL